MKATLEFNLPEDREEHRVAVNAMDIHNAVVALQSELRGWQKYGHQFKTADEVIDHIRKFLMEELP